MMVVASVYDILSINRKDSGSRQAIIKWVKYKLLDPKIKGENDTMLIFVSKKLNLMSSIRLSLSLDLKESVDY